MQNIGQYFCGGENWRLSYRGVDVFTCLPSQEVAIRSLTGTGDYLLPGAWAMRCGVSDYFPLM